MPRLGQFGATLYAQNCFKWLFLVVYSHDNALVSYPIGPRRTSAPAWHSKMPIIGASGMSGVEHCRGSCTMQIIYLKTPFYSELFCSHLSLFFSYFSLFSPFLSPIHFSPPSPSFLSLPNFSLEPSHFFFSHYLSCATLFCVN